MYLVSFNGHKIEFSDDGERFYWECHTCGRGGSTNDEFITEIRAEAHTDE